MLAGEGCCSVWRNSGVPFVSWPISLQYVLDFLQAQSRRTQRVPVQELLHGDNGASVGKGGGRGSFSMGLKLLLPVPASDGGKSQCAAFSSTAERGGAFPVSGSTDQMFHRVIENSILSESICCQKVLSLLQQRG